MPLCLSVSLGTIQFSSRPFCKNLLLKVGNSDFAFNFVRKQKSFFFRLYLIDSIVRNDRLLNKQQLRVAIRFVFYG